MWTLARLALVTVIAVSAPVGISSAQGRPPPPDVLDAVLRLPTEISVQGTVVANSGADVCTDSRQKVGAQTTARVQVEVSHATLTLRSASSFLVGAGAAGPIDGDGRFEATGQLALGVTSRWVGQFGPHGSGFARVTIADPPGRTSACTVEWHATFLPTPAGIARMEEIESWRPVAWPELPPSCLFDPASGRILATVLEGGGRSGLYAMESDGSCLARVADFPAGSNFFSGVSPDGLHALVGSFVRGTDTEWRLIDLRDGSSRLVPGDAYTWPVWTRGGRPVTLRVGQRAMGTHPWGNRRSVASPDWSRVALAWDVYGPGSQSNGILVVDTATGAVVASVGPPPELCAVTPPPLADTCAPGRAMEPLGFTPDGGILYYRVGPTRVNNAWTAVEAVRLDGSGELVLSQQLADAPRGSDLEWHLRAVLWQTDALLSAAGTTVLASVPRGAGFDLLAVSATGFDRAQLLARTPARLLPLTHRLPGMVLARPAA